MMVIAKFQKLPLAGRALMVLSHATFLICMDVGKAGRSLHFFHGFYVQLIYNFHRTVS
jgi:hypothetical protein